MAQLTAVTPAPWTDCLDAAGGARFMRQAAVLQRCRSDTVSIRAGDALLAVAYLWPHEDGSREFCLALRPAARPHMLALVRFAHLMLARLTQDGAVVFCHVTPGHLAGERMARLTGFERAGTDGRWDIGSDHDKDRADAVRRR